ncbi:MAG: AAA family ATPase [Planctomycetota bacterium]
MRDRLTSVVAIKQETLEPMLVALLAQGHVLIEGIPGIGKTLLARTLARCVAGSFNRVQFTNDLMPTDIVGSMVWRPGAEKFSFVRGPLFANIVLTDEINRTSPRTLSCLLEAMENGKVTVEGKTIELADPFMVLATRNPIEFHGTFPVPEAALDRFLVRVELEYPSTEKELSLYMGEKPERLLDELEPVLDLDQLRGLIAAVDEVQVSEPVAQYCFRLVEATRQHDQVALGASPRAALNWLRAGRAMAIMQGRDYVLPDDLKAMAQAVLAHRIFLKGGGEAGGLLDELLVSVPVEL